MSDTQAAPQSPAQPGTSMIAERLGEARVELRPDLEVSRHLFRGKISYVVQDPLTTHSHRLGIADYCILSSLRVDRTLAETFASLVQEGRLDAEDEERFFQFIYSMHRAAFLKLPISDEETLHRRHVAKLEQRRKGRIASLLFYRVPVCNPDSFLVHTLGRVRPLCTRVAFFLWLALVATAFVILFQQWGEFRRPVADIFSGDNLPLLWVTLIVLKVAHEFGHAYACRHYGGHVPEMGLYFILFTPCAYVDTTSSWGFPKKWQRFMVCMAGMYVELAIAALAMLLWSVTDPGLARSALHNVVVLASVVTIGFNINPLMRYDGYYALSDLVEIPNLRARSQAYATAVLKRATLGVPITKDWGSSQLRFWLLVFGVSGAAYKVLLVVGISTAIATKILLGGLLVGGVYFGNEIVKIVRRTLPYLWYGEEAKPMRTRAVLLSILLFGGLPLAVAGIPIPSNVSAPAVLQGGTLEVVRAETSGFLSEVHIEPGARLVAGSAIARLEEPDKRANLAMKEARLEAARLRRQAFEGVDLVEERKESERVEQFQREVYLLNEDIERLTSRSLTGGTVVACVDEHELGRFVKRGEELATLTQGRPRVRALLTEDDVASARPAVGMRIEFRTEGGPDQTLRGTIERIAPAGTRRLDETFLEHLDPAQFALHPITQEASRQQFEVEVELEPGAPAQLMHGMSGRLRLEGRAEPVGRWMYRKVLLFADQLGG